MNIKVLGSACKSCNELYEETLKAIKELGENYEVEYISDLQAIVEYQVMTIPALIVNDKIIVQGKSLKAKEIEKILVKTKEDEN